MAKAAKKYNQRTIPDGKSQVNFNITTEFYRKVKAIASNEDVPSGDIFNLAIQRFIEAYEQKNGKVKIKPKGDGLKEL